MIWSVNPLHLAVIATVMIGCVLDLHGRRIPNVLTVSALLVALCLRGASGASSLVIGMMGAGLAFTVLLPLFLLGGVGGGDAKLLAAVGAFLGPPALVVALLATAIAGGLMAIAYSIKRGVILPALLSTRGLLTFILTGGRLGERTTLKMGHVVSIPYGVAIAAGTIFALWYGAGA